MGEALIDLVTEAIMNKIPMLVIKYYKLRISNDILLENGVMHQISNHRVSNNKNQLTEDFLHIYEHIFNELLLGIFPTCLIKWEIPVLITMTIDNITNLFQDKDVRAVSIVCIMFRRRIHEIGFICHDLEWAQTLQPSYKQNIQLIPFQHNKIIEVNSTEHINVMLITEVNVWRSIQPMLGSIRFTS